MPTHANSQLTREINLAKVNLLTEVVRCLRSEIQENPNESGMVLPLLQAASEELNKHSRGKVSQDILTVQERLMQGDAAGAFRASLEIANRALSNEGAIALWSVQLMRIAAIQSSNEHAFASYVLKLEDRGVLEPHDTAYHPVSFALTPEKRAELRADELDSLGFTQRSKVWRAFEQHGEGLAPVNGTAVSVGPRAGVKE